MSLSKIVISGRVVRAPEKRFTPNNNVAVTEFTIGVDSQNRQEGTVDTNFVKVITWRDLAERCSTEIKKGDVVCVDGRLQINNFTTQEGQKKREVEIDASSVENLSSTVAQGWLWIARRRRRREKPGQGLRSSAGQSTCQGR